MTPLLTQNLCSLHLMFLYKGISEYLTIIIKTPRLRVHTLVTWIDEVPNLKVNGLSFPS